MNKAWFAGGGVALIALLVLAAYGVTQFIHLTGFVNAKVTGANSASEFLAEQNYNTVYSRNVTQIQADTVPYAATSTSPGVCNKGGTAQGCYDTDQKVLRDLHTMLIDVGRLNAPPRYLKAHVDLLSGVQLDIDGLTLRDQLIASKDPNASFAPSNLKLQQAASLLHQAYTEFPPDNAPLPKL